MSELKDIVPPHSGKNFEDLWNLIQEEKNELR